MNFFNSERGGGEKGNLLWKEGGPGQESNVAELKGKAPFTEQRRGQHQLSSPF